jgi:radical SAM-linked protein
MTDAIRHRVRLRFAKQREFRFTSHRDLVRALERTFRRAGLRLSMSEGFHPKPRMSFPLALALGVVGQEEVMELELAEPRSVPELLDLLNEHAPSGLSFHAGFALPPGDRNARVGRATYRMPIPAHRRADLEQRIEHFLAGPSYCVVRQDRGVTVDIRPLVEALRLVDDALEMTVSVTQQRTARPREILEAMQVADLEGDVGPLVRTRVELNQS